MWIVALGNLYGMVHKDKVVEIYNKQNEDQIGLGDVKVILAKQDYTVGDSFIYAHGDYFVHETILEFDEFDLMLRKKGTSPTMFLKRMSYLSMSMIFTMRKTNRILLC